MSKNFQNILVICLLLLPLISCDGNSIFQTQPCGEGKVREGNACMNSAMARVLDCFDPDLSSLRQGKKITMCDGSIGEGKLLDCTKDGEQNCVNKSNFKAANTDNFSSDDLKIGKIVAEVSGLLRAYRHCRNYSSLSTFDSSYPPSNLGWTNSNFLPAAVNIGSDQITFTNAHGLITNSPVRFTSTTTLPSPLLVGTTYYAIYISNTVIQLSNAMSGTPIDITTQGVGTHTAQDVADGTAQYFDTIDDYNNNQTVGPENNPWSSNEYLCDANNFVNMTTTSPPLLPSGSTPSTGNQPFTQIWQDQISGIYISNILYDGVPNNRSWSDAIRTCESLNAGNAGNGWRLPTQKELIQLYIHGISKVPIVGGSTFTLFWSSSGSSISNDTAWNVNLARGNTANASRYTATNSVLCIR